MTDTPGFGTADIIAHVEALDAHGCTECPAHEATFQRGEQIAYVPTHARVYFEDAKTDDDWLWSVAHPAAEFGFVTSQRGDTVFCRYWRKGHPGDLRTVANSEGTPADCLVKHRSVRPAVVERALEGIERVQEIADSLTETPAMLEQPPFDAPTIKFFGHEGEYEWTP